MRLPERGFALCRCPKMLMPACALPRNDVAAPALCLPRCSSCAGMIDTPSCRWQCRLAVGTGPDPFPCTRLPDHPAAREIDPVPLVPEMRFRRQTPCHPPCCAGAAIDVHAVDAMAKAAEPSAVVPIDSPEGRFRRCRCRR